MNTINDFDRRAASWLADGPTELNDRVLEAALREVHLTHQRRRLPALWRLTNMPLLTRATASAAVLLVAAIGVGGALYLSSQTGGPDTTPTPAPTSTPATTTSPTARPARMEVQGDSLSWTADVPPGWSPAGGWFMTPSQGPSGPTGISVTSTGAVNVPTDPCDGVGKVSDAESAADVVADLQAREDLVVSGPIPSTLGGYAGMKVDVEFPADLSACGEDLYIIFAEPDGSGFYAQGPSNEMRIWIVDVEGRPVVFFIQSFPATPAGDSVAAQQIVDSIVITP